MHNNQVAKIENDHIRGLRRLHTLNANANQIAALPDTMKFLKRLNNLHLADNKLSALPNSITWLKALKILNLDNNQINVLDNSLVSLTSLTHLFLKNNQLMELPDCFYEKQSKRTTMMSLRYIDLVGNPICEKKSQRNKIRKFKPRYSKVYL